MLSRKESDSWFKGSNRRVRPIICSNHSSGLVLRGRNVIHGVGQVSCDRAGMYSEGVHSSFVFLVLFSPPDWACFPFLSFSVLLLLFLLLFSTGTSKQATEICPRSSSMSIKSSVFKMQDSLETCRLLRCDASGFPASRRVHPLRPLGDLGMVSMYTGTWVHD